MHFSVLSAISQLSQVFQLLGVALTRRTTSRKPAVLRLITVDRALPLAYIFLPFLLPTDVALVVFLAIFFLYGLWWMLAIGIASPFWGPFMIKKLGMSLLNIQVYGTISTMASLLALRPWGALIDRFGNKTAMRFALVLGGLNPILWVFVTPQHYELVYFEAATSGIMWSGAGIVATNLVLAIAPDQKRQVYSAVFGAFSGVAMMVTMLLSGATLPAQPLQLGCWRLESEQLLFGLGGLARWSTQIPLSWIREPQARPAREVFVYLRQEARQRLLWLRERASRRRK